MKKSELRELLTFSSRERSGIIVLSILLILSLIVSYLLPQIIIEPVHEEEYKAAISEFQKSLKKKERTQKDFSYFAKENAHKPSQSFQLSAFDPNTVSKGKLMSMGFNRFQADNVINYRNSGGTFYSNNDFLKLYTIDSTAFKQIKPFIAIKGQSNKMAKKQEESFDKGERIITIPIEMNSCTVDELTRKMQLPDDLAERIIKYRKMLGGFVDESQLKEVYGFEVSRIDTNRILLSFNNDHIKKIDVNNGSFGDFVRHPYIDKYTANAILEYRKFMKTISTLEELENNNVIKTEMVKKIAPYLLLN